MSARERQIEVLEVLCFEFGYDGAIRRVSPSRKHARQILDALAPWLSEPDPKPHTLEALRLPLTAAQEALNNPSLFWGNAARQKREALACLEQAQAIIDHALEGEGVL